MGETIQLSKNKINVPFEEVINFETIAAVDVTNDITDNEYDIYNSKIFIAGGEEFDNFHNATVDASAWSSPDGSLDTTTDPGRLRLLISGGTGTLTHATNWSSVVGSGETIKIIFTNVEIGSDSGTPYFKIFLGATEIFTANINSTTVPIIVTVTEGTNAYTVSAGGLGSSSGTATSDWTISTVRERIESGNKAVFYDSFWVQYPGNSKSSDIELVGADTLTLKSSKNRGVMLLSNDAVPFLGSPITTASATTLNLISHMSVNGSTFTLMPYSKIRSLAPAGTSAKWKLTVNTTDGLPIYFSSVMFALD